MIFVQPFCNNIFDNFLSHTHIIFLIYLSVALIFVLIPTFSLQINDYQISCQPNGCSDNRSRYLLNVYLRDLRNIMEPKEKVLAL